MKDIRMVLFALAAVLVCGIAYGGVMDPQVQYATGNPVEIWKTYLAIAVLAFAGMAANFLRRWLNGSISGSPIDYLVRDNPKRTALALFTLAGSVGGAIAAGQFEGLTIQQLLLPSFLLGYASDTLNKGAPTGEMVGKT
jgi:hypothetical protein